MGIFNKNGGAKSRSAATTLIAKGCVVSGKLKLESDIQVDGRVDGQLNVDGALVISESGYIKGEVFAKRLVVNGTLEGSCHAERIQILSKGQVKGKIFSQNLSIEPGGKFYGETSELPKEEVVAINTKPQDNVKAQDNAKNQEIAKTQDIDSGAKKPERALKTA